jgi:hypothetical protein
MLMEFEVCGTVIEWRGPAPFFFLPMSKEQSEELDLYKRELSYGWGVIPCQVTLGSVTATTSLFPKDGVYLVPLKDILRKPSGISAGDQVTLNLKIRG